MQVSGRRAARPGHSKGLGRTGPGEGNRIPRGSGCLALPTAMSQLGLGSAEGHSAPATEAPGSRCQAPKETLPGY